MLEVEDKATGDLDIIYRLRHFCEAGHIMSTHNENVLSVCVPVLFLCLSCPSTDLHFDVLPPDPPPSERSSPVERRI